MTASVQSVSTGTTTARRVAATLVTLVLLLVVLRLTVFTGASFNWRSANPVNQVGAGTLTFTNSKDGAAIVSAVGLRPGQSSVGTVTLTVTGNQTGRYTLNRTALTDLPSGTTLSGALTLTIEDITGTPVTLYSGTMAGFTSVSMGSLAPGEVHVGRFTVTFPIAAATPSLQGASSTLTVRCTAVSP
jgi:spore coat-associated protein N